MTLKLLILDIDDSLLPKMIPEISQTPRLGNTVISTGSGKRSTLENSRKSRK